MMEKLDNGGCETRGLRLSSFIFGFAEVNEIS